MEKEHSELQKQIALEEKNFPVLTVPMVHFFLRKLKDGNVDDIKYRKTLINVFINKIYLYDDKLTIIFNSGDNPVTINDFLLSEIEDNSKKAEGLFLDGVAPPIESLYEHLSFSSCEEEMNCCVRIALYFFHHQGITIDTM